VGKVVKATLEGFGKLESSSTTPASAAPSIPTCSATAAWDRLMDINAKGVFLGMKDGHPGHAAPGGGAIVKHLVHLRVRRPDRCAHGYNASKGAVRIMTKTAAVQYAKDGIPP